MDLLEETALMQTEWSLWHTTNRALRDATGGQKWDDDRWLKLHAAIILWSESLVALRLTQSSEIVADAYAEAQQRYERLNS